MESNCKNKYNLDHIYCHTNDNNYIRANAGTPDVLALLKEIKHLKAMLLLHLDLIQEQSDQIMAKEKLVATLREENDSLKLRLERMERRSQLRSSHKSVEIVPISNISPATTDKVSTTAITTTAPADKFKEDKKENIPEVTIKEPVITSPVPGGHQQTSSNPSLNKKITTTTQQQQSIQQNKYKVCEEGFSASDSIIGESNGKLISKIVLQRVQIPDGSSLKRIGSPVEKQKPQKQPQQQQQQQHQRTNNDKSNDLDVKHLPNKHFKNFIEVKTEPENHDTLDDSHHSFEQQLHDQDLSEHTDSNQKKRKRSGFMTTKRSYRTREWENEQINEEAGNKEEVEALNADAPNLEIPKWTIKEFTGLYSIEGTEDLSDDVFSKRHSKLEYDEKRRKKWDVQRIREQRTIERLRRRHYKDEIQNQEVENQEITSFYPTSDQIKFIQITEDLPVQAFGDCIPRILPTEFCLPWRESSSKSSVIVTKMTNRSSSSSSSLTLTTAASSSQQHFSTSQQYFDSLSTFDSSPTSLVFLKKKRRLQSQGTPTVVVANSKRVRRITGK